MTRTGTLAGVLLSLALPAVTQAKALNPLKIVEGKFSAPLRGGINCCSSGTPGLDEARVDGWPLATDAALDKLKVAGLNFTHFRTGPYKQGYVETDPPLYGEGYDMLNPGAPGSGVPSQGWLRNRVLAANARGLYVEIDLIDNWSLATQATYGTSYFKKGCGLTNVDPLTQDPTQRAIVQPAVDWVRAVVDKTGDLGVIYNLGNEGFRCTVSTSDRSQRWEEGMRAIIKGRLRHNGWPDTVPIGSSFQIVRGADGSLSWADRPAVLDYRTFGDTSPLDYVRAINQGVIALDKPTILTEDNNETRTPQQWEDSIVGAERKGAYVAVFRKNMTDPDFKKSILPPLDVCGTLPADALQFHLLSAPAGVCRLLATRKSMPSLIDGTTYSFQVTKSCGIPPSATAVSVSLTSSTPSDAGYLETSAGCSATAANRSIPGALSTIDFPKASVRSARTNNAVLPLSAQGRIAVQPHLNVATTPRGTVELAIDVTGYFAPVGSAGHPVGSEALDYTPLPWYLHLIDTRDEPGPYGGPSLIGGVKRDFDIKSHLGYFTSTARALAGNAQVQVDIGVGSLQVARFDSDPAAPAPPITSVSYIPDETVGNGGVFPLGEASGPDMSVWSKVSTEFMLDAMGYFSPDAGSRFHPLKRCRLVVPTTLSTDQSSDFGSWGACGIPPSSSVTAIVANITVSDATGEESLVAYATGASPWGSSLDYKPSDGTVGNTTFVSVSDTGFFTVETSSGRLLSSTYSITVDVMGYFSRD